MMSCAPPNGGDSGIDACTPYCLLFELSQEGDQSMSDENVAQETPVAEPVVVPAIIKIVPVNADRHADVAYIRPADVLYVSRRSSVLILNLVNREKLETDDPDGALLALFVPEEFR
jgi:hypothetical protein